MFVNTDVLSQKAGIDCVEWKKIATLPGRDRGQSIGVAGAVNAVYNNSLIVAGGANFPDKMPWEGGKKHFSDELHVLQKKDGKYCWDEKIVGKLPEPVAYCGNISTPQGIVYAGGENDEGLSARAYLIKADLSKHRVKIYSLPDLPVALSNLALTSIGNVVYAIGGDKAQGSSSGLFSLDLQSKVPRWNKLPDLPTALANTVAIAQNGPDGVNIYVVGGRARNRSGISDLHHTLYIYNPRTQSWKNGAPISDGSVEINFSAGTGVAVSDHFLLITGGDDGRIFHQIETFLAQIATASTQEEKASLTAEKNKLITAHHGFYKGILLYSTLTNSWIKIGDLPFPAPVTTTASKWGGKIVLSNGEIKPGVRTPDIMLGTLKL